MPIARTAEPGYESRRLALLSPHPEPFSRGSGMPPLPLEVPRTSRSWEGTARHRLEWLRRRVPWRSPCRGPLEVRGCGPGLPRNPRRRNPCLPHPPRGTRGVRPVAPRDVGGEVGAFPSPHLPGRSFAPRGLESWARAPKNPRPTWARSGARSRPSARTPTREGSSRRWPGSRTARSTVPSPSSASWSS